MKGIFKKVSFSAHYLANELKQKFGKRVLGPEAPGIARIRNYYHQKILLKFEREASISKAKEILQKELQAFAANEEHKSIRLGIDVDPL